MVLITQPIICRCSKTCHTGECSDPSSCKKRSKIYCPCKRRKEDRPCAAQADGSRKLGCDSECQTIKDQVITEVIVLTAL
jgi:NF-X1-type zinc finger protein NFXL1